MGNCMGGTDVVEQVEQVDWKRAHPTIKLSGAKAKMTVNDYAYRCAIADVEMSSGQHFCEYKVVEGTTLKVGVVRPKYGDDPKMPHMKDPHLETEHCTQICTSISRTPCVFCVLMRLVYPLENNQD